MIEILAASGMYHALDFLGALLKKGENIECYCMDTVLGIILGSSDRVFEAVKENFRNLECKKVR